MFWQRKKGLTPDISYESMPTVFGPLHTFDVANKEFYATIIKNKKINHRNVGEIYQSGSSVILNFRNLVRYSLENELEDEDMPTFLSSIIKNEHKNRMDIFEGLTNRKYQQYSDEDLSSLKQDIFELATNSENDDEGVNDITNMYGQLLHKDTEMLISDLEGYPIRSKINKLPMPKSFIGQQALFGTGVFVLVTAAQEICKSIFSN